MANKKRKKPEKAKQSDIVLTREQLEALDEDTLCKRVLVPLFRSMGYQDVRFTGGRLEQGKDITMWRREKNRDQVCYGVVAKVEPITGRAASQTVVTQVLQCLGSRIVDRSTNQSLAIDKCIVVSSRAIGTEADYAVQPQLETLDLKNRVSFIDGPALIELLKEHRSVPAILGGAADALAPIQTIDEHYGYEVTYGPSGKQTVGIVAKTADAPPLKLDFILTFSKTAEDLAKLEEVRSSFERGTHVSLPSKFVEKLNLPDLARQLIPHDVTQFAIEIGPSDSLITVPMSLRISDERQQFNLPYVEMKVARGGTKEVLLSNRDQRLGFLVEMVVRSGGTELTCGLNRVHATFEDAVQMHMLIGIRQNRSIMELRSFETNEIIRTELASSNGLAVSKKFADVVRRVATLGSKLGVVVPLPKRDYFTAEDLHALADLERIVATGEVPIEPFSFRYGSVVSDVPNGILRLHFPEPQHDLMDVPISLGPGELHLTNYKASRVEDGQIEIIAEEGSMLRFSRWTPSRPNNS